LVEREITYGIIIQCLNLELSLPSNDDDDDDSINNNNNNNNNKNNVKTSTV